MRMAVWPLRIVLPGADHDTPLPAGPEHHPRFSVRQLVNNGGAVWRTSIIHVLLEENKGRVDSPRAHFRPERPQPVE